MIHRLLFLTFAVTVSAQEAAAPAAPAAQKFDFQALAPGEVPDDYMATDQDAKFVIAAEGDNKYLELQPQPIVDGGMLVGKSVKGPCTITAKIKATGKRRTHPRFGVGLHGISGPRLRVVPATKSIEIITSMDKEEAVATAPYTWVSGTWTQLELSIKPSADAKGSLVEARVWEDGKPRPEQPTLTWNAPNPPAQGKASVWGTPYSEQAIRFDDIEVK
jgi:hypothetical protein